MKKLLMAVAALILAIPAFADSDCCFDLVAGQNALCTQQANQANCFARAGRQAFAVAFNCINNGDDECTEKAPPQDICQVYGQAAQGGCTNADLSLEPVSARAPEMSLMGMVVMVVLLGAGALWMFRRQSAASA